MHTSMQVKIGEAGEADEIGSKLMVDVVEASPRVLSGKGAGAGEPDVSAIGRSRRGTMGLAEISAAVRSIQRTADFFALILQILVALGMKRLGFNVAISVCIDKKKTCIVALESKNAFIFSSRIHKRRFGSELLPERMVRLLKRVLGLCKGIDFFVWGYAEKQFFGFSFSDYVRTFRVETGLFGVGARYNGPSFSYVVDQRAPYFDGRAQTDLESLLLRETPGAWRNDTDARTFIEKTVLSGFQKYAEVNQAPDVDVGPDDIVVVGQCQGDAAWIETDSVVVDNVDLVHSAFKRFSGRRILYKPHPFNKLNDRDVAHIRKHDLAQIVGPRVSFSQIAARRPLVVVNTSGAGLEAALRGCKVHTFGTSYYSHWGFTSDSTICSRRVNRLTPEDVFYVLVYHYCKYGQRHPLKPLNVSAAIAAF